MAEIILQSGDSLSKLSQEHGVPIEALVQVNGLEDQNDTLYAGRTFIIPDMMSEESFVQDFIAANGDEAAHQALIEKISLSGDGFKALIPLHYDIEILQTHPETIRALIAHGHQNAPVSDFDLVINGIISSYVLRELRPEAVSVLAEYGVSKLSEDVDMPFFLGDLSGRAITNIETVLEHIDYNLSSDNDLTNAITHLYGEYRHGDLESRNPDLAPSVLSEIAESRPDILSEFLNEYIYILGDNKTAEFVTNTLEKANQKVDLLDGLYDEFGSFIDSDDLAAVSERDEIKAAGLNFENREYILWLKEDIGESIENLLLGGLELGLTENNLVQSSLISGLDLSLIDDDNERATFYRDQEAVQAAADGSPLGLHYLDYIIKTEPRRLLEHQDIFDGNFGRNSPVAHDLIKRAFAELNYDLDALSKTTGVALKDIPYHYIHKTAGPDTLSQDMMTNPAHEFEFNIPGFGLAADRGKQLEGYIISVEHSEYDKQYYNDHLMATANIIDRTLAALGQQNIKTITLLPENGVTALLGSNNTLLNNALIVQSSTASSFNLSQDIRLDNSDLIMVFSADNDGDKIPKISIESETNGLGEIFNDYSNPDTQWNNPDPTTSRHLAVANTIECGASIYNYETNRSEVTSYSQKDGQTLITTPVFPSNYKFHADDGPYEGHFETGTSFASPICSPIIGEARAAYPDLQSHHIIYAMAQSAAPVTSVQDTDSPTLYKATPHGGEFSHVAGFGDLRRDAFEQMLGKMQFIIQKEQVEYDALVVADPETPRPFDSPVKREDSINFDFTKDNAELTEDGRQLFALPIDLDEVTTRPVFSINYTDLYGNISIDRAFWPLTITSPNGTQFDYMVDLEESNGKATISGVGFMGAETQGVWTIEAKDPESPLAVLSVDVDMFTVPKDDLITRNEFRKIHTLESIADADLSHLRDLWIQDGGIDSKGGWISKAPEENWDNKINLSNATVGNELLNTLQNSQILLPDPTEGTPVAPTPIETPIYNIQAPPPSFPLRF